MRKLRHIEVILGWVLPGTDSGMLGGLPLPTLGHHGFPHYVQMPAFSALSNDFRTEPSGRELEQGS